MVKAVVIRKEASSFPVVKFDNTIVETGVESGLFIKEVVRKGE